MSYFLGADLGSSKTLVMIAHHHSRVAGLGLAGPGNHQVVGYQGMALALQEAADQALAEAGIAIQEISVAGFGISGYDWPFQELRMHGAISGLELQSPLEIYNESVIGLLAGVSPSYQAAAATAGVGIGIAPISGMSPVSGI